MENWPSVMNRLFNLWKRTLTLSPQAPFVLAVWLGIPLLVVMGFGLWAIIDGGFLLEFSGALLLLTAMALLVLWLLKQKRRGAVLGDVPADAALLHPLVSTPRDWGPVDQQQFTMLRELIRKQLVDSAGWGEMQGYALQVIEKSAELNRKTQWAFSLPEILYLIEDVSRRYRKILLQHVPGIEHIELSWIKFGMEQRQNIYAVGKIVSGAANVWRVAALATPVGVLSELRRQVTKALMAQAGEGLQWRLKQAFLEDVAIVAINLYSGRLNIHDTTFLDEDDHLMAAEPVDPLRIVMIGQVSAGKSSIVNALMRDMVAETSLLPSTNDARIYSCSIEGMEIIELVDLPGLNGEEERVELIFQHATKAHVIVHVLRADQSARQADLMFRNALEEWYRREGNLNHRRAPLITVLSQVDRLKPARDWSPPYDLETGQGVKVAVMRDAMDYNLQLLGEGKIIPLSVSDDRPWFNLDKLEEALQAVIKEGINTQLNRHRLQRHSPGWLAQIERVAESVTSLFRVIRER